jgi:hypothetical protein
MKLELARDRMKELGFCQFKASGVTLSSVTVLRPPSWVSFGHRCARQGTVSRGSKGAQPALNSTMHCGCIGWCSLQVRPPPMPQARSWRMTDLVSQVSVCRLSDRLARLVKSCMTSVTLDCTSFGASPLPTSGKRLAVWSGRCSTPLPPKQPSPA